MFEVTSIEFFKGQVSRIGIAVPTTNITEQAVRRIEEGSRLSNLMLLQSTGLTDKNGKEIFEGDIVRIKYDRTPPFTPIDYKTVVEWKTAGFYPFVDYESYDYNGPGTQACEVIGNVWENPDPLPKA